MSRRQVDVAFRSADLQPVDVAVVIDVLRATSTVTAALAAGYRRVHLAESLEAARGCRTNGTVLAGERACVRPPDFDLGNSPAEMATPIGTELVLATTNGAPTVVAATDHAPVVLLGCLFNEDALLAMLAELSVPDRRSVQLVCSGTNGETAVEDAYVAGRMVTALRARSGAPSDAALVAEAVANAAPSAVEALGAGSNAEVLRTAGLAADIADCARISVLDIVGRVSGCREGVATVVAA